MSFLLSICIPTYNRCSFLNTLVSQWIKEINKLNLNSVICIDIVDNSSTDITPRILEELSLFAKEKNVILNYIINSRNIGIGGSLFKLIKSSDSDYIWTMGDDDSVDFSMLNSVVKLLKGSTHGVILLKTLTVFNKEDYESFISKNGSGLVLQ